MRQSQEGRALRQFTLSRGKSAGRNSSGRITVFHRGGGSKRLQRRIDLKRSTSSMGIVERIEYEPNRSSRIAPVRWIEGVRQRKCNTIEEFAPPPKILESTTTTILSFVHCGPLDQRKVACFSPGPMAAYVVVGLPTRMSSWSKSPFTSGRNSIRTSLTGDELTSWGRGAKALKALSFGSSFGFPRIAVAGAKPAFFAPRIKGTKSLDCEGSLDTRSIVRGDEVHLLVGPLGALATRSIVRGRGEGPKDGTCKVDRAPVV